METAGPRRDSKTTPEGMLVVAKNSGKIGEKSAERMDGGAEMEARKGDINYMSRMVTVVKLISVKEELRKMKKDHNNLTISLQLMQKELERVNGDLKKRTF